MNVIYNQYGQREEKHRRKVEPPCDVKSATWRAAGQLDYWVKERGEWWGRVRGADGHHVCSRNATTNCPVDHLRAALALCIGRHPGLSAGASLEGAADSGEQGRSRLRGRMPVLVFEWQPNGWVLHNVGSGPALNVIIAQGRGDPPRKGILLQRGVHEPWFNPVQLPPLARDAQHPLSWIVEESGLGATYADALGASYTAKCGNDRSIMFDGVHLPVWQDGVRPHWQLAGTQPTERWQKRGPS